jgi:hypothetical protein
MIIHDLNFVRVAADKTKAYTPLVIDPDRMLPGSIARSTSNLLDGGNRNSSTSTASSNSCNLLNARRWISRGRRRLFAGVEELLCLFVGK